MSLRCSKDLEVKYGGVCLIQMARYLALSIMTGNSCFDNCADVSFVSGGSFVDYVLISTSRSSLSKNLYQNLI